MKGMGAIIGLLLTLCTSRAQASYIYEFSLDAVHTPFGIYAADVLSFDTPELITGATQTIKLNPVGDLNGLTIGSVDICSEGSWVVVEFCGVPDFLAPVGAVANFAFYINFGGEGIRPGLFYSKSLGRGIREETQIQYFYTAGTLAIREMEDVPLPGTLALIVLGLTGVAWKRRNLSADC